MAERPAEKRHVAVKIAATYAVLSALWILLSDAAVNALVAERGTVQVASTLKGWVFVVVTALLLFAVTRRYLGRIEAGEGAARAAADRLSLILQTVPSGIIVLDTAGRIMSANDEAQHILRLTRLDLAQGTYDDPSRRIESLDGKPIPPERLPFALVMAKGQPVFDIRHAIVHPDGDRALLSVNAGPLRDRHGETTGVLASIQDITQQQEAEDRTVHVNRLYSMLSQTNQAIVRIRDADRLYKEACRITVEYGRFLMAWVGVVDKDTGDIRPVADAGRVDGYLEAIRVSVRDVDVGHGPVGTAARLGRTTVSNDVANDPHMLPWREPALARGYRAIAALPLRSDGETYGVLAIYSGTAGFFDAEETRLLEDLAQDIAFGVQHIRQEEERGRAEEELARYRGNLEELVSERTAELSAVTERLREATEAKSAFLSSMSHELRTPLNSIIGFTGILLKGMAGRLNAEQEKQLGMVYSAGKNLLALIDDVLDLSKIEAGRMSAERSEFTAEDLASSALATIRPLAEEKGLALSTDLRPADALLRTDRDKLQQILVNLLGNAVKFTDSGSVILRSERGDGEEAFSVEDTGRGIPQEELAAIFEEFRQVKREPGEPKAAGTGLGLTISRRLARMLGGDVTAASELGKGSTFTVRVPAELPETPREETR